MNGLNARLLAIKCYINILSKKLFIEDSFSILNTKVKDEEIKEDDISFIKNLLHQAIRNKFHLENILFQNITKETNIKVINLLILALCEYFYLSTKDYAIINTYVEASKKLNLTHYTSFINGVLRNIFRKDKTELFQTPIFPVENEIYNDLILSYGEQTAKNIYQELNHQKDLDLVVLNENILDKDFFTNKTTKIFNHLYRLNEYQKDVKTIAGFDKGSFFIQSFSSYFAIYLVSNYLENSNSIADLCASPGGKSILLNLYSKKNIDAYDISKNKLLTMEHNLSRLNLNNSIHLYQKDILSFDNFYNYDFILIDSPCSATGTINKHPEIIHNKTLKDIKSLAENQFKLLNHVYQNTKPQTYIYYCTCSLQKQEGEEVINKLVNNKKDIKIIPLNQNQDINHTLKDINGLQIDNIFTKQGLLRILPHHLFGGTEGFFAALLLKE